MKAQTSNGERMRIRFNRRVALAALASTAAPSFAWAQALPTAIVALPHLDPASTAPAAFGPILRRELELALAQTGLFNIPTRDAAELNAVLDEIARTGGRSSRARGVDTIVMPTVTSYELQERRRPAPNQETRDLITTSGRMSLQITVMDSQTAEVRSRFPLDVTFRDQGRLADRTGATVTNAANTNAYLGLAREAGRALADYVRARNPAADASASATTIMVVERVNNQVFLNPPTGLAVGDELRVFAAGGREIRHPQTGEVLGRVETEVGRVRVTELQARMAVADVIASTGDIAAGATVRR